MLKRARRYLELILVAIVLPLLTIVSKNDLPNVNAVPMEGRVFLPSVKRERSLNPIPVITPNPLLPTAIVPTSTPQPYPTGWASPTLTPTPFATKTPEFAPSTTTTATPTVTTEITPTASPTPLLLTGESRFGVWTGSDYGLVTRRLQESGGKWARVMVFWDEIEPDFTQPPAYIFAEYDNLFSKLNQAGISPIAEIRWNPRWAATTSCGPIDKPGGMEGFESFLRILVQRYKEAPYNVKQWEFYNEPDNTITTGTPSIYAGCFGDYPAEYVTMLRTAYRVVKDIDPEAEVLLGGLAFDDSPGFNIGFLERFLAAGGGPLIDIMNIHYYSSQSNTWASYGRDVAGKVEAVRQIMARYGVNKPVAVTEISWTSSDPESPDFLEKQARYVPKAMARGLSIDLRTIIWFSIADWEGAGIPFGLVDTNFNPKKAFDAYRMAATEFGNARSVRSLRPEEVRGGAVVEGYVFDVGGQERWVLWAEGNPVSILIPAQASQALDHYGHPLALRNDGASTPFQLSDSPIYVRF